MRDAALILYERQALQFLQTMTIKFSPMSDAYNATVTNSGGSVSSDETTWKYYLNLTGQYHSTDTMMTVQSLDTQQTIDFTVDNLATHSRTAAAYVVGSTYYADLCTRYPGQTDLIKSIVYPVKDMQTAIQAEDFTVLSYGNGFLEPQEIDVILADIVRFISYMKTRWYLDYLSDEVYFYWCFWGMMWQTLFGVIMASRLNYIKTAYANSFHVWAYLESVGLSNYKNILSTNQANWLYRNIDYLLANQGKQSNLTLLADNLLTEAGVGLVGKTIYHSTATQAAPCTWDVTIVSESVPTQTSQWLQQVSPQTVTELTFELFDAGLEKQDTAEYIGSLTDRLAFTWFNMLPTKLLEIQPLGLNTEYADTLNNFVLDHLVYNLVTGIYAPNIDILDPITATRIQLTGSQAMALYYYCCQRSIGVVPSKLPDWYSPNAIYKNNIPSLALPTTMTWNGVTHKVVEFFNSTDFTKSFSAQTTVITDPGIFSNFVGGLFNIAVSHIRYSRSESDFLSIRALHQLYDTITIKAPFNMALDGSYTNYTSWLTHVDLTQMIAAYDASVVNAEAWYSNLADQLLEAMLPLTNSTITHYMDNTDTIYAAYTQIRQLFIQLCSYNVAFMDTTRNKNTYIFSERILLSVLQSTQTNTIIAGTGINTKPRPIVERTIDVGVGKSDLYEVSSGYSLQAQGVEIDTGPVLIEPTTSRKIIAAVDTSIAPSAQSASFTFGYEAGSCMSVTNPSL